VTNIHKGPADSPEQLESNRELAKIAFPDGLPSYGLALFDPGYCGKLSVSDLKIESTFFFILLS
jgi:DNA excision repair protein ERCC-6-like 2